ncbi:lysozyme family protein [Mesobacillus harenae]|uniref:lysozyme family protein n=1 Tax=Mesobacillus harenae TaxID=2213203 RepID=UPI001580AC69|nr:lysozyme family protein [Mesobacillus harenae]
MRRKQSKKKIQRNFNIAILLFFLCVSFVIADHFFHERGSHSVVNNTSEEVQKHTPTIRRELQKVQLEEYTVVLAAIMQQESNGQGGDPMQSSESLGLAPNSISDPEQSIRQGVKHFEHAVTYGSKKQVDFQTVIQAYNMGIGYIDYVEQHGGKHSEELAKEYSHKQVQKKPEVYNCRGDKTSYLYPYCYGDYTYSTKIVKNIETLTASSQMFFEEISF